MFKVDKEDGLFTLGSVFLVFENKKLLYLLTFKDDLEDSKKWNVFSIDKLSEVLLESIRDLKIRWKKGNDSLSAKHVSKSIEEIEKLGFDVWFWPYTIKNKSVKDFYLQDIKPKLK